MKKQTNKQKQKQTKTKNKNKNKQKTTTTTKNKTKQKHIFPLVNTVSEDKDMYEYRHLITDLRCF